MAATNTGLGDVEAGINQFVQYGEKLAGSAKDVTLIGLNTYDRAVDAAVGLELRLAEATQLDWVNGLVKAHAGFVKDIAGLYSATARELIG
jgi:hypothetical protein